MFIPSSNLGPFLYLLFIKMIFLLSLVCSICVFLYVLLWPISLLGLIKFTQLRRDDWSRVVHIVWWCYSFCRIFVLHYSQVLSSFMFHCISRCLMPVSWDSDKPLCIARNVLENNPITFHVYTCKCSLHAICA